MAAAQSSIKDLWLLLFIIMIILLWVVINLTAEILFSQQKYWLLGQEFWLYGNPQYRISNLT